MRMPSDGARSLSPAPEPGAPPAPTDLAVTVEKDKGDTVAVLTWQDNAPHEWAHSFYFAGAYAFNHWIYANEYPDGTGQRTGRIKLPQGPGGDFTVKAEAINVYLNPETGAEEVYHSAWTEPVSGSTTKGGKP